MIDQPYAATKLSIKKNNIIVILTSVKGEDT